VKCDVYTPPVDQWRSQSDNLVKLCKYFRIHRALSINTARAVRTVTLLNGIQNVWSSDLSDRKI
jgi:predicted ATP-grasp superfamily ATP-dependent carboligase